MGFRARGVRISGVPEAGEGDFELWEGRGFEGLIGGTAGGGDVAGGVEGVGFEGFFEGIDDPVILNAAGLVEVEFIDAVGADVGRGEDFDAEGGDIAHVAAALTSG